MIKKIKKYIILSHKYLGIVIFSQLLVWSFSGFVIYYLDFSALYTNPPEKNIKFSEVKLDIKDIKTILKKENLFDKTTSINISNVGDRYFYKITLSTNPFTLIVDQNGKIIKQIDKKLVTEIVLQKLANKYTKIKNIELLKESSGNYYSKEPIYKVTLEDKEKSEMYIDPTNGKLLAKRNGIWGFYNKMWEFHLMKYTSNNSLNKNLLLISALISFIVSLTGFLKILI